MDLNNILESLGDDTFTTSRDYTRLDENGIDFEAQDAERRRLETQKRNARRKKGTGTTAQGAKKTGIELDWQGPLSFFGKLGTDSNEIIPLSRNNQYLIRADGNESITTHLNFIERKSENGVTLNKFPQNCYPKYFTGSVSKDDDIKLYASMHSDNSLGNAPLDFKSILKDIQPSKVSGGKNSLVSTTSFIKSKVTQAMGYANNGVILRWTGNSGEVTHSVADLLIETCRNYLGKVQSADSNGAFGPHFEWEALRKGIEGILLKANPPQNDYEEAKDGKAMTAGVSALIAYQYASLSSSAEGKKRGKKFKKPKVGPIPLDLIGNIGDQHYTATLSEFFAYKAVLEFQKLYKYDSDKSMTNGEYLESCSDYLGILTNIKVDQASAENEAEIDNDNAFVVGGHDMDATPEVIQDSNDLLSGDSLRSLFSERIIACNTPTIRESFKRRISLLTEKSGAGRGVRMHSSGAVRDAFSKAMKFVSYDVMNKSTHRVFSIEPYDFNNYYSLDLRIDTDTLLEFFTNDNGKYQTAFDELYDDSLDENMRQKILLEYQKQYDADVEKLQTQDPNSIPSNSDSTSEDSNAKTTKLNNPSAYQGLSLDELKTALSGIYKEIGVVSLFIDAKKEERITIKQDEFVDLVKTGLSSAIRGNVPQGVTIEEILDGKFSRKAIAPDQGTFINRVKDPTSDKEFDFRSWTSDNLKHIHEIILGTFKNNSGLKGDTGVDKSGGTFTRESIMLYLTQDDFHQLEQGGKGMDGLADKAMKSLGQMDDALDW